MLMGGTRMSGKAVKAKTGKDWKQWFSILDKAGATKMSHKEIAEYLYEKRGVPGWWAQTITVTYEQERGLREKHQKADGYAVSASRTSKVPISVLYKHWSDEKLRRQWLKDKIVVRKATANKSMRITWPDNSHVDVYFYEKGAAKSQAAVQHSKLASAAQVKRMRSRWKAALERLAGAL
jgi:hypothetical protein